MCVCVCLWYIDCVCVCVWFTVYASLCEIGILIVGKLKFYLLAINQVSAGKHSGKCGKFDAVSAQLHAAGKL